MIVDVVCGRTIESTGTIWASHYHGGMFFFCSLDCHEQFELEPEDFLPIPQGAQVPTNVLLHIVA